MTISEVASTIQSVTFQTEVFTAHEKASVPCKGQQMGEEERQEKILHTPPLLQGELFHAAILGGQFGPTCSALQNISSLLFFANTYPAGVDCCSCNITPTQAFYFYFFKRERGKGGDKLAIV